MPSSTPEWSALASENERVVVRCPAAAEVMAAVPGPVPASVPGGEGEPAARPGGGHPGGGHPGGGHPGGPRRQRWRSRGARTAAASGAAALAVTAAAGSAAAADAPPPLAWHVVAQVSQGQNSGISAIVTGGSGGWAFAGNGTGAPTAFRRHGSAWTPAAFPGRAGETVIAAAATGPSDVWALTDSGTSARVLRFDGAGWAASRTFGQAATGVAALSSSDAWVFGASGAWHWNGRTWTRTTGRQLLGGSALAPGDVWAFGGTDVAHWNGRAWSVTNVARLLPARDPSGLNDPGVAAIYAQSADSVWAVGNGAREDEGGPVVLLHFNGRAWSQVASSELNGDPALGQVAPDGQGGLWIPVPGQGGAPGRLLHYTAGHLTAAALPLPYSRLTVSAVAWVAGSRQEIAGGYRHAAGNPGVSQQTVILQYER